MNIKVKFIESADVPVWDSFVNRHPGATLYHLSKWNKIIQKAYGHQCYYLVGVRNPENRDSQDKNKSVDQLVTPLKTKEVPNDNGLVSGLLPLIHLNHFVFGNRLISLPYFDLGGILGDGEEIEKALLNAAIELAKKLNVGSIDLRHHQPLPWLGLGEIRERASSPWQSINSWFAQVRSHKVRMIFKLPGSSDMLMKSFKAKLRSQIMKPIKEGLKAKIGGLELLHDFYEVFSINMRDLGSPVHSKRLIEEVIKEFGDQSKIVLVHKEEKPLACSLVVGFKDILENPWASALAKYSRLSPNMLLYWTMLEYACDNGYAWFDFGRSSPGEGTYRFKEQWGAKPTPLYWYYLQNGGNSMDVEVSERSKFDKAIRIWQKLPVPVTQVLGPMIRKHISL